MPDESEAKQVVSIPSWASPVLIAIIMSLGGGAVGLGVGRSTSEQPAAIVTSLAHQTQQMRDLNSKVDELRRDLNHASEDRWTRTDMSQWRSSDFAPARKQLAQLTERVAILESRISSRP